MEGISNSRELREKITIPSLEYKQKKFPTKFTVYRDRSKIISMERPG
jgi:hypothetical protein